MDQSDANERTPSLPKGDIEKGGGPVSALKQKKEDLRAKKAQKIQQSIDSADKSLSFWLYCGGGCVILCFVSSIYGIYYYYSSTFEERNGIDEDEAVVEGQWKDFHTHELVNCSNANPCRGWSCSYVLEHFHKTPDECQYHDHMRLVTIILCILGCLGIIEFCK
jgi:hypothetical protein